MKFIQEFKEFAIKSSVIDLAVGVIIGGAFGKIVSSLVEDVITPLLLDPAMEIARVDNIAKLTWGKVKYGSFLSSLISFVIIALVIFIMVKVINKLKRTEEDDKKIPVAPTQEELLAEIRDLLKK